jgi:hypothetical protein
VTDDWSSLTLYPETGHGGHGEQRIDQLTHLLMHGLVRLELEKQGNANDLFIQPLCPRTTPNDPKVGTMV